jgi:thioredoxin-dependent peroxiredoxin
MLKEGDSAPNFALEGADGNKHWLGDYRGRYLVLYFYPKDNTPGCTIEAKDFSSRVEEFRKFNTAVVGVSKDDLKSHQKFVSSCSLGIMLLSDPDLSTIKAYDSYGNKGIFGMGTVRNTFIIDKNLKIIKIYTKVSALGHAKEVLDFISSNAK